MILVRQVFPQNQRAKTVLYNSFLGDVCRVAGKSVSLRINEPLMKLRVNLVNMISINNYKCLK